MDKSTRTTVVGVFDEAQQADRAISALHQAEFSEEQIGYIRRDSKTAAGTTKIANDAPDPVAAVGAGAVIGGLVGAAAALLIPGVGPVLAGGILVNTVGATAAGAAVVGAVGGAVAGGLLGALTNLGVPEDEARYADEQFQAGRTIVTVKAVERAEEATTILRRFGAHDIHANQSSSHPSTPMSGMTNESTIPPIMGAIPPENR